MKALYFFAALLLLAACNSKKERSDAYGPSFSKLAPMTSDINLANRAIRVGGKVAENSIIGGGFNTAGNLIDKNTVTDGLGTSMLLGGSLPLLGEGMSISKTAIQNAMPKTAESIIGALVKPLGKDFAYGKDPIRGILNEGITANSIEDLGNKVISARNTIGERIGQIGDTLTTSPTTLDLTPSLKPLDVAMQKAASQGNQTLVDSLFDVKNALSHDMGLATDQTTGRPIVQVGAERPLKSLDYSGAIKFISDITDHTRFTGNASDDKALNMATKQAYGVARQTMNETASKINPELGKELVDLNSRYADLSSAKLAINHRDLALRRANFISLAGRVGFGLTTAGALATGLMSGDWAKAGAVFVAGLGELGISKAADSPAVITRVANFLNNLGPTEKQGIIESTPVLKNYWDRYFHGGGTSEPKPTTFGVKVNSQSVENKIPIKTPTKLNLPSPTIKLPSEGILRGQANIK